MRAGAYLARAVEPPRHSTVPATVRGVRGSEDLEAEGAVRVACVFDVALRRFVSVWIGPSGLVLFSEGNRRAVDISRETLLQVAIDAGIFAEANREPA